MRGLVHLAESVTAIMELLEKKRLLRIGHATGTFRRTWSIREEQFLGPAAFQLRIHDVRRGSHPLLKGAAVGQFGRYTKHVSFGRFLAFLAPIENRDSTRGMSPNLLKPLAYPCIPNFSLIVLPHSAIYLTVGVEQAA